MKYCAILLVALIGCTNAVLFNRPCRTVDDITVKSGFNVQRYLGVWFEIERYEQAFQVNADCVTAQYSANADGSVRVLNRAQVLSNGTNIDALGTAFLTFPNEVPLRAMLNVTFDRFPSLTSTSNYWVISTDYFSYSVVWGCNNLPASRSVESFWVLSRSPTITSATTRTRIDTLIDLYVERDNIRTTEQTDAICLNRVAPSSPTSTV